MMSVLCGAWPTTAPLDGVRADPPEVQNSDHIDLNNPGTTTATVEDQDED